MLLEDHAVDQTNGGYIEVRAADWSPSSGT
jgi:hypothetical protein